ncbi:hypothetical protein AWT69_003595 [Pseudomonas putida]|nr:hypothetical protein AWT69_003595 [Pseudomonas putida]
MQCVYAIETVEWTVCRTTAIENGMTAMLKPAFRYWQANYGPGSGKINGLVN